MRQAREREREREREQRVEGRLIDTRQLATELIRHIDRQQDQLKEVECIGATFQPYNVF